MIKLSDITFIRGKYLKIKELAANVISKPTSGISNSLIRKLNRNDKCEFNNADVMFCLSVRKVDKTLMID